MPRLRIAYHATDCGLLGLLGIRRIWIRVSRAGGLEQWLGWGVCLDAFYVHILGSLSSCLLRAYSGEFIFMPSTCIFWEFVFMPSTCIFWGAHSPRPLRLILQPCNTKVTTRLTLPIHLQHHRIPLKHSMSAAISPATSPGCARNSDEQRSLSSGLSTSFILSQPDDITAPASWSRSYRDIEYLRLRPFPILPARPVGSPATHPRRTCIVMSNDQQWPSNRSFKLHNM
jgi:hypothetical protein